MNHSLVLHGHVRDAGGMNRRDSLLAALVATIWGFNFVVIDWGMDGVPPLLFAAIRFAVVVFPAVLLAAAARRALAGAGRGRRLHVAGPVRPPLRVDGRRACRPAWPRWCSRPRSSSPIVIAAGVLRERPNAAQVAGRLAGRGRPGRGRSSGGAATSPPPRSRCACWPRCRGGSATWSRAPPRCRAACRSRSGRRSSCRCRCSRSRSSSTDRPRSARRWPGSRGRRCSRRRTPRAWRRSSATGSSTRCSSRNPSAYVVPWVLLAPVVAMASAWLLLGQSPNAAETAGGVLLIVGVLVALRPRPQAQSASRALRPASSRATGTRNGEQET